MQAKIIYLSIYLSIYIYIHTHTHIYREINKNTRIVGEFNIPITPMDISTKQGNNKETQTLNDTIDQIDLIDI